MPWKLLTGVVLVVVLAGSARPDAGEEVVKALDALNAAFAKGDAEAAAGLMTDDHVAVTAYYGGPIGRADQLKALGEHELTTYKPGRKTVRQVGADTYLVTYELAMAGKYKGKALPGRSYATAIWTRRGGKWQEAYYQETPLSED